LTLHYLIYLVIMYDNPTILSHINRLHPKIEDGVLTVDLDIARRYVHMSALSSEKPKEKASFPRKNKKRGLPTGHHH